MNLENDRRKAKGSFVENFTNAFEKFMPDSMTVAFILLLIVIILAVVLTGAPLFQSTDTQLSVSDSMAQNFWNLLQFSMQITLIAVLGNVFASSPPIKKGLRKICSIPKTTRGAYIVCATLAFVLSFIHWAIGMMAAIVIGKEMLLQAKKRNIPIHTPNFIAAIFGCALIGWSGIAASPVLFASTPGYLKTLVNEQSASLMKDTYSVLDTVLYAKPIITIALSFIVVLAVFMLMRPKDINKIEGINEEQEAMFALEIDHHAIDKSTIAKRLSNSIILQYLVVIFMAYWCVNMLIKDGFLGISINSYNYLILTITLACCLRPRVFVALVMESVSSVWGFIVQYPFYAAIFGVIVGTGLDEVITNFFLSFATERTWPSIAMLYSGIMNIFVPSGGSKFIIEAPYIIPISQALHTKIETIIMAYSYGDCGTNMLAPFWWILPCGMFKISLHKVMPYALVAALSVLAFDFIALLFW